MTRLHRSLFKKVWIPKYKYQLVEWLSYKYPPNAEKFRKMKKRQLHAIYCSVRGIDSEGRV